MKFLFYFGHPSQYLCFRYVITILRQNGHSCDIFIKTKDVLEELLRHDKQEYTNILPEGRKNSRFGILTGLIKRDLRLLSHLGSKKPDLLIGSDPSLAHIGFLKQIPVITVVEDDIDVIPDLAKLTYPFTSSILTPLGCRTGKYERKTVHFDGYMKLAYLHPCRFTKDVPYLSPPYSLIRLSSLNAYHDKGIKGFTPELITKVIDILGRKGRVYISSEKKLPETLSQYQLPIEPFLMHNILANALMLVSDSQSMSMEAAMLGIPSIRFSDFTGRITVLEELEKKFSLTFGIKSADEGQLLEKVTELAYLDDISSIFKQRLHNMLKEKIDVTAFFSWFIQEYPTSRDIMKKNHNYQKRFLINQG